MKTTYLKTLLNCKSLDCKLTRPASSGHLLQRLVSSALFHYVLYCLCLIDPVKDFYVEDHEVVNTTFLPTENNDDYWEKRFCLRMDMVPAFLIHADNILRTGKYLNVIQQCD